MEYPSPDKIEPGIYFHLPEEIYHRIPALSASGVKALQISPAHYWRNCAPWNWSGDGKKESHFVFGDAGHKGILEGMDKFEALYGVEYDAREFDGLVTNGDLKDHLSSMHLPTSGNKPDLIKRIREGNPEKGIAGDTEILILDEEKAKHGATLDGKTLIKNEDYEKIVEVLERMQAVGMDRQMQGDEGASEVTFVWHDEGLGCLCKARVDRVNGPEKPVIDLKSFSNKSGREMEAAAHHAFTTLKYHYQGAFYLRALTVAPRNNTDDQSMLAHVPTAPDSMIFLFLSVSTTELIPVKYRGEGESKIIAMNAITASAKLWNKHMEEEGRESMWKPIHPMSTWEPETQPEWAL